MQRIDQPVPIHISVQDAIKNYIAEQNLQAGDPLLPETELARRLDVSRNSVREAVKALESLGILETRRGIGVFVKEFTFDAVLDNLPYGLMQNLKELSELLEVRRVLEVGMIPKAIAGLSPAQIKRISEILDRMKAHAEHGEPFDEVDREFHRHLFLNIENDTLLKLLDLFWLTFNKTAEYASIRDNYPVQTYRDHVAIFDAVVAGDVATAQAKLEQHYEGIAQRIQKFEKRDKQVL